MQKGLVTPIHPAMLDPQQYQTQEVYLSVVPPPTVTSMAALLASSHVAPSWGRDYSRVTLAEFLPVSRVQPAQTPIAVTPNAAPVASSPAPRNVGERCPVCSEIVGERLLLTSTYIGCLCG